MSRKERLLVGKRVSRVDCNQDRIVAQCKDGTSYEGAVIVGADGVHSMVRQEMWRHMNLKQPGMISDVERSSESSWVRRIMYQRAREKAKQVHRRRNFETTFSQWLENSDYTELEIVDARGQDHEQAIIDRLTYNMDEAIRSLRSELAQVIILRYFEDLSDAEIAKELKIPLGTVKTRMRAAYRELQKKILLII